MDASIAIQVLPKVETNEEVCKIVDQVIEYIKRTGLTYHVGPFETTIEGDFEELMDIIKECQYIAINRGAPSVMSYVKIYFKPEGGALTIEEKIGKHNR